MRRLPIFFVVDVSESMVADLPKVDKGLQMIVKELSSDPYALETVFISTIAFAGRCKVLNPLTEVYSLNIPRLPLGGGTDYGEAFTCLMREIDRNVVKTTINQKGDWKPLVFFFTDGNPTSSSYKRVFDKWRNEYSRKASVIAFSLAAKLDYSILGQITEQIYLLDDMDDETVKGFFKWVSASIQTNSVAVGDNKIVSEDRLMKDEAGEKVHKINLKKESRTGPGRDDIAGDESVRVVIGKCAKHKKRYIDLYRKDDVGIFFEKGCFAVPDEHAYDELSSSTGSGSDLDMSRVQHKDNCNCPHCNNPVIITKCSCGRIFCCNPDREKSVDGCMQLDCPWCGNTGYYQFDSFSVGTGLG